MLQAVNKVCPGTGPEVTVFDEEDFYGTNESGTVKPVHKQRSKYYQEYFNIRAPHKIMSHAQLSPIAVINYLQDGLGN